MFDFAPTAQADKAALYADLVSAADALTRDEPDAMANMANISALLWLMGDELVLGPFQGKPACIRIPVGRGVCGAAAATRETQLVEDVHAFPGHIACDAASASEVVVPVIHDGALVGVIDLDSPRAARFDADDATGLEGLATMIAARIA